MKRPFTGSHPLDDVVIKALESQAHDAISLGTHLAGRLPSPTTLLTAYKHVAQDILDSLKARGLASTDDAGWYHLARQKTNGYR